MTPAPTIADLNRQPVQETDGTTVRLSKGQTFGVEPRAGGDATQPAEPGTVQPESGQPPGPGGDPGAVALPDANSGQRAGIETARLEV